MKTKHIGFHKLFHPINEDPTLEFITSGTRSIKLSSEQMAQFCPHLGSDEDKLYCQKNGFKDTNCFWNKYIHCDIAIMLDAGLPKNPMVSYYRKYKRTEAKNI